MTVANFPPAALMIVIEVCETNKIRPADLIGPSRNRQLCTVRWDVWAMLYERRNSQGQRIYSMERIGDLFGRHHTSIVHGLRRRSEGAVAYQGQFARYRPAA